MIKRVPLKEQMMQSFDMSPVDKYQNMYITFVTDLINSLKNKELYSECDIIKAENLKKLEKFHAEWEDIIDKFKELDNAIRFETNRLLVESSLCSSANNQRDRMKVMPFSAAWGWDFLCVTDSAPKTIQEIAFRITSLFALLGYRIMQIFDLQDKIKGLFAFSQGNKGIPNMFDSFKNELKNDMEHLQEEIVESITESIRNEKKNIRIKQERLTEIIQKGFVKYVKKNQVILPQYKKILTKSATIDMLNDWNSFLKKKKGKVTDKNRPCPGYPEVLYGTEKDAERWIQEEFAKYYINKLKKRKNRAKKTDALDGPHYGGNDGEQKIDEEKSIENTDIYFDDQE